VALGHAGGGGQWGDAAEHGEACFGAQSLVVVAGGDQQLPGDLDADAGAFEQLRRQLADDGLDELIEGGDLVAEFEDAAGEGLQRDAGGAGRVGGAGGVGAPGGTGADELHPGQVADLVADLVGGRDDAHAQQLQGVAAGADGGAAGDAQDPQGLDGAVFALGDAGALPTERGTGGADRVQVVVFALAAPVGAVRAVDLEDLDPGVGQMAGDPGAVAAGPLNPDPGDIAE
jgi:hypothetical protein